MNHDVNTYFLDTFDNYRPQRSWAKVMFLQASVILSTGGCLWQVDPLGGRPPQDQTLAPGTRPPRTRHPPWRQTAPGPDTLPGRQTPSPGSRLQHTVNERPVRILLKCILVNLIYLDNFNVRKHLMDSWHTFDIYTYSFQSSIFSPLCLIMGKHD